LHYTEQKFSATVRFIWSAMGTRHLSRIGLDICMRGQVTDVINHTKFCENRSKGFRATRPRKTAFPIDNVHRPYNSVGTTVPHCDGFTLMIANTTSYQIFLVVIQLEQQRVCSTVVIKPQPAARIRCYSAVTNIPHRQVHVT